MKYGIYYAYWEQEWDSEGFSKYIDKIAALGFDVLEINGTPLPDYSQKEIKELKSCADAAGIQITTGYGPVYEHDMGSADVTIRKAAFAWYKKLFDVMEQLDSHMLGGALYSHWPIDYSKGVRKEEDWKRSVEGIQLLGPLAKEHGITLGMEILNRFENHILNTAEEGVRFVTEVGQENVKVMLDTFHMNIEEDSLRDAILTAGPYLGHFHVGECNRKLPGNGRIPWKEVMGALREAAYQGCVIMEPFVRMGGRVGEDIKVWRDLSGNATVADLDQAAEKSLAYLKNIAGI